MLGESTYYTRSALYVATPSTLRIAPPSMASAKTCTISFEIAKRASCTVPVLYQPDELRCVWPCRSTEALRITGGLDLGPPNPLAAYPAEASPMMRKAGLAIDLSMLLLL